VSEPPAAQHSTVDAAREDELESRWEAAPAVIAVILLQVAIAMVSRTEDWSLWVVPWWVWLIGVGPEVALLVPLANDRLRHRLERSGHRRLLALALFGVMTLANALLLVAVLASLISGHERSGAQLLVKAGIVWSTNTITFALWFWALDSGGPIRRLQPDPPPPDFLFPQLGVPPVGKPGWYPRLFDYLYVSFTNSIAFSPTDTLPLSGSAKLLMLVESSISALTVLLIGARAVNIFV